MRVEAVLDRGGIMTQMHTHKVAYGTKPIFVVQDERTRAAACRAAAAFGLRVFELDKVLGSALALAQGDGIATPNFKSSRRERALFIEKALPVLERHMEAGRLLEHSRGSNPNGRALFGPNTHEISNLIIGLVDGPCAIIVKDATYELRKFFGPAIAFESKDTRPDPKVLRFADSVVSIDNRSICCAIEDELQKYLSVEKRLKELRTALKAGKIPLIGRFKSTNWPTDPLMSHVKMQISPLVEKFVAENGLICDAADLKHQVLFRLTTLSPMELFTNGHQLEQYLQKSGVYSDWRNILLLEKETVSRFRVNDRLINEIIHEQSIVVRDRVSKSSLPLSELLAPSEMFSKSKWFIHTDKGGALHASSSMDPSKAGVPIEVKEVDRAYAFKLFNDMHYIHTPRVEFAVGLFVKGEGIPFSVHGLCKVDRQYKKDALLLEGYNPSECWDFTRMYSRPGSPMNTSSVMLSRAVQFLIDTHPEVQACVTAFTPSFANGKSMLAGGFDSTLLVKPLVLKFGRYDNTNSWQMLTRRRRESYTGPVISSKMPLLPTFELIRHVQSPRFAPLITREVSISSNEE